MISICIPVYNFCVEKLVTDIVKQAESLSVPSEIIVIDDASEDSYKLKNKNIESYKLVKYIELKENIGRSKIRNLFLNYASYENLLFIDCDAEVNNTKFLHNYIDTFDGKSVVVGGVAYSQQNPGRDYSLRWTYGHKRESTSAIERSREPYKSFKTFNFAIPKQVFKKIFFDESLIGYGHEDTIFGLELKKAEIKIVHIENPLIHTGLETNEVFLKKSREGIDNLLKLLVAKNRDPEIVKNIKMLYVFSKLNPILIISIKYIYIITLPLIEFLLKQKKPNICFFDFYKLGYICSS
jgi:GT2 family glycosyltransferase